LKGKRAFPKTSKTTKKGKVKMSKVTKKELNNMIVRYAVANEQKKPLVNECKELGDEIKDAMAEREITTFAAMGYTATVTFRKGKKLNMAKLEALLTKEQLAKLAECYDPTITPTLTVTPTAANAEPTPKVEKVRAA
jgi:hypothetical protein